MKIKVGILSLFMAFMFMTGLVFAENDYTDSEQDCHDDFLISVGILDEDFVADKPLTRGAMALYLSRLLGEDYLSSLSYDGAFEDVATDDVFAKGVTALRQKGFVRGYSDGTFKPQQPAELKEAVKIIVDILGYRYNAENYGGYPSGYLKQANALKILDGVTVSSEYFYGREFAQIVYNALKVDIQVLASISGDNADTTREKYTIKRNETILTENMNMYHGEGVVNSNDTTSVTGASVSDNELMIGTTKVKITDRSRSDLIGYNVDYVYRVDKRNNDKLLVYAKKYRNEVITIHDRDFIDLDGLSIRYYEEGKEKSVKLRPSTSLIYNGCVADFKKTYFDTLQSGTITIVDNDADGMANVVIIYSYQGFAVGAKNKNSQTVYDSPQQLKGVSLDENKYRRFSLTLPDGREGNFDDVNQDMVLIYYIQDNCFRGQLLNSMITGIITEVTPGDRTEYVIGEKRYTQSKLCTLLPIKAGERVNVYLDMKQEIIDIKIIAKDKLLVGYLLDTAKEKNTLRDDYSFLIYTPQNKEVEYKSAKKIQLNGKSIKRELLPDTIAQGVILYNLSEAGEINILETAVLKENYEEGRLLVSYPKASAYHYMGNRTFAMKISYTASDTVIFSVPETGGEITSNQIKAISYTSLEERTSYTVEAYHTDINNNLACAIVVYKDISDSIPSDTRNLAVLDKVARTIDDNGNEVCSARVFIDGVDKNLVFADDVKSVIPKEDYKTGDVFRFALNADGEIANTELLYRAGSGWYVGSNPYPETSIGGNPCIVYGRVIANNGLNLSYLIENENYSGFLFDCYVFPCSRYSKITVINNQNGRCTVSSGNMSDACFGDKMIDYTALGASCGFVLIRE